MRRKGALSSQRDEIWMMGTWKAHPHLYGYYVQYTTDRVRSLCAHDLLCLGGSMASRR